MPDGRGDRHIERHRHVGGNGPDGGDAACASKKKA